MNRDFNDMLSALSAEGVEYLVVGAYALAAHGFPRATGDIDIWVRPTPENARRLWRALAGFGAPLAGIERSDFERSGTVYQIGVAPNRIDLLTEIDGVAFEEAWPGRLVRRVEDADVAVIGRGDLIRNKRATGRTRDLADAEQLEGG
jgi:hypothetical protein